MKTAIPLPIAQLESFCDRWQITELSLFGSIFRFRRLQTLDQKLRYDKAKRSPGIDKALVILAKADRRAKF